MKVAFIAGHEFMSDQKNGGRQCAMRNYQAFRRMYGGENVYVIALSNTEYPSIVKNVRYFKTHRNRVEQMFNACTFRNGYNKTVEKQIVEYVREIKPDIVYFDHSFQGFLLKSLKKVLSKEVKIITFMHNIEKDHVWDKVVHENVLYFIPYLSYYYNEKYLVKNADAIINLTERDANRLFELYERKSDFIFPITYDDKFDENKILNPTDEELSMLFVGTLFGPNVHGLKWFISEVMPKLTGVKLNVVGFKLETIREQLQQENTNVIGTVEDISEEYYKADIVVLPIFYGNGMKTKTAEAMMYGKMILATDEALEGYEISFTTDIIRCNDADSFIKNINRLKDYKIRKKYCSSVRDIFVKNYSSEKKYSEYNKFMEIFSKGERV